MTRYEIDPDGSQVWIEGSSSVHPIRATATGLTGWVELGEELRGEVRIEVGRLQSGNPLVDRETRRRVDAGKFPEIVGTVIDSERNEGQDISLRGEIEFRGEVRSVAGRVTATVEDDTLTVEGSESFDVRDWGLEPPRVALLRVHPDVTVRIHIEAAASG
jgi:polyisoprenoid-binding protein YceI